MNPAKFILVLIACLSIGCTQAKTGFLLPPGQAEEGKLVFEELRCFTCHALADEGFLPPVVQPAALLRLREPDGVRSRESLAEAILSSSKRIPHHFALDSDDAPPSMEDFSQLMTVRELIDVTEYLQSVGRREAGLL